MIAQDETIARGQQISARARRALLAVARQWRAAVLLAALIGAWELYVDLGGADPLILPAPTRLPRRGTTTAGSCGPTSW